MFKKRKKLEPLIDISTKKGFEWLYNTFWEKVFTVCYHSTEDLELSREMTQDIFKSIWQRRDSLEIWKSHEHYLVRAAKLKVAEHFRNQTIRKKHYTLATQNYQEAANSTEQDVNYTLLVEELNILVEQLSPQCKKVFKMSREHGMSNKEIATDLQVSERAVEYHISKALNFLRQQLPEYKIA
ncbi:MAG: sigma-70 family RNA polymerase sigma factor [Bacteroidota bacterium]